MANEKLHEKRARKREEAETRNEAWQALPPNQQLRLLKFRPGECKKQIARIRAKM